MHTAYRPTADRNLYLADLLEKARRSAHRRRPQPDPTCPECAGTGRWLSYHGLAGSAGQPCPYCWFSRRGA